MRHGNDEDNYDDEVEEEGEDSYNANNDYADDVEKNDTFNDNDHNVNDGDGDDIHNYNNYNEGDDNYDDDNEDGGLAFGQLLFTWPALVGFHYSKERRRGPASVASLVNDFVIVELSH